MVKWYDRIGNSIEMKLFPDADRTEFEWVKGKVISGYRYQDGIITMEAENGRKIWCGTDSGCYRRTEESLGDLITNADRIRTMCDEEIAEFFCGKFMEWNKECDNDKFSDVIFTREERFLSWLKSEVKE